VGTELLFGIASVSWARDVCLVKDDSDGDFKSDGTLQLGALDCKTLALP
jgi:hypothetical protein